MEVCGTQNEPPLCYLPSSHLHSTSSWWQSARLSAPCLIKESSENHWPQMTTDSKILFNSLKTTHTHSLHIHYVPGNVASAKDMLIWKKKKKTELP